MNIQDKEAIIKELLKFLEDNNITKTNMDDNKNKIEQYLKDKHLGINQYIPGVYKVVLFDNNGDKQSIGKLIYYNGKNGGWGFETNEFSIEKKEEGTIKELPNEIEVVEVNREIPKQLNKVNKNDKDFEEFLTLYTPLIDNKFSEEYGNIEDKDLWNDLAKEMYLKSKYYILKGDEVKPEKVEESKKLTEHLNRVKTVLLKYANNWIEDQIADEEDKEYYSKWTDDEKIEEWFANEIEYDLDEVCKELDITLYNGNLELSSDHVLNTIAFGIKNNEQMPDEYTYGDDVTHALENFESDCKELDGEVYTDGRMGRHIVIKPTLQNLLNYDTIKEQYMKAQEGFIESQIDFYNNLSKEEESVQVRPGADDINIEEDIFNTFNSAKSFESNFGKIYIIKDKYDKLYKIYKPNKLNINDYVYYTDSKEGINGFLDGAVKAINGVFSGLKTESKTKIQEDSYDKGIFYEIEQAFEEAGLQPSRFSNDGILTRNIGWTVTSPETGKHQQISCDGSWYDEDEYDKELDESKKLNEELKKNNLIKNFAKCKTVQDAISNKECIEEYIINDFFTNAFNDMETEEDMNEVNEAEDIIRKVVDIYNNRVHNINANSEEPEVQEVYNIIFGTGITESYNPIESKLPDLAREVQEFMYDYDTYEYNDNYMEDEDAYNDVLNSLCNKELRVSVIEKLKEIIEDDNLQEIKDKAQELINRINEFEKELGEYNKKEEDIQMTTTKQNLQDVKTAIDNNLSNIFKTQFVDAGDVVGLKLTRKQDKVDLIAVMDSIINTLDNNGYTKKDYEIELMGNDLILGMNNIAK